MNVGISVYSVYGCTTKANIEYIDMASSLGVTTLFTSFNIVMGNRLAFDEVVYIPQDRRLDVVGKVDNSDSFLLEYIGHGIKFKLIRKDD